MSRRWLAAVGALGAGAAAGALAVRRSIGRVRLRPDPEGREPFGRLTPERTMSVLTEDGIALYVEEAGDLGAPLTLLLVHGLGLSMDSWHYQRRDLSEPAVARLVLYDGRGHGRSAGGTWVTDGRAVDDLAAVIDQVVPEGPLVLVGHSTGATAVTELAVQRPELFATRVVGVALLSPPTAAVTGVAVSRLRRRLQLLQSAHAPALAFSVTRRFCFGGRVSPAVVDSVTAMLVASTGSAPDGAAAPLDVRPLAAVETVLVTGAADRLAPPAAGRAIAELLPDADLVVLPGAGHLLMMERPSLVTFHLLSLVGRARDAAGDAT